MIAKTARLALMAMLMISIGMHWALLQTVAWAGMIVSYSKQTSSLSSAISMTFDGKHPCKLCTVVKVGRDVEKSSEKTGPSFQKLELFSQQSPALLVLAPLDAGMIAPPSLPAGSLTAPPPLPPPRVS